VRTYEVSRDPAFVAKVTDVVGLYLHPPEHAIVLSVDEKTSIQALQRTQPPLPLRAGRAVRHTHDYRRHGVLDLFAALEVATGTVTHRFSPTHARIPTNRSTWCSTTRRRTIPPTCVPGGPRIQFHYTPTSASWLNQIEGFLAS
jgi:hypothetical protein